MPDTLTLFPPHALDQSLLTSVLIGIFVLLFFCEVFGWVWAGLVVPGYLASVYAVAPQAGLTVSVQAIISFLLARLLSDVLAKLTGWSAFFGRERFFLIVLVSVVVRQSSELWFVRLVLEQVDQAFGLTLAHDPEFSSIGLVLVPLVANMFWKLTLTRGVFQIGVTVLVTYLVLAVVILPYTNLSVSSFEASYEDIALDFLGSPKAYIILLTTAFIAAYGNLVYGWDYNGILVPSLLALTWFTPFTTAFTVGEALLLASATKLAVRLPGISKLNLEGPRKVTTVFTVGYILKFVVGWGIYWLGLDISLPSLFGFGFVLTSLLAVKIINTKKIGRVVGPSLAVSLGGFVVGSGIGLGLHLIDKPADREPSAPLATSVPARMWQTVPGAAAVFAANVTFGGVAAHEPDATPRQTLAFWRWLASAGRGLASTPGADAKLARVADMEVWSSGALTFAAPRQRNGRPMVIAIADRSGPVLLVRHPRRERWSAQAAAALCERLACRAMVMSSIDVASANRDAYGQGVQQAALAFEAPVLEVGVTNASRLGSLEIQVQLPGTVSLAFLQQLAPDGSLPVRWRPSAVRAPLGWAKLRLLPHHVATLLDGVASAPGSVAATAEPRDVVAWIASLKSTAKGQAFTLEAGRALWLVYARTLVPSLLDPLLSDRAKRSLATSLGLAVYHLPNCRASSACVAYVADQLAQPVVLVVASDSATASAPAAAPAPAPAPAPASATASAPAPATASASASATASASAPASAPATAAAAASASASAPATAPANASLTAIIAPARAEAGATELAAMAFGASHAAVLLVNAQAATLDPRLVTFVDALGLGGALPARLDAKRQPWFAFAAGIAEFWPAAHVMLLVRGFSELRGLPGELYVATGQPVFEPASLPPVLLALAAPGSWLRRFANDFAWVDGRPELVTLLANTDPVVSFVRRFGGPHVGVAWFADAARRRLDSDLSETQIGRLRAAAGIAADSAEILPPIDDTLADRLMQASVAFASTLDLAQLHLATRERAWLRMGYATTLQRGYIKVPATRRRPARYVLMGNKQSASCDPHAWQGLCRVVETLR